LCVAGWVYNSILQDISQAGTVEHFNRIYFCVISTAHNADLLHTPHCRSPGRLAPCSSYWRLIQDNIHLWGACCVFISFLLDLSQTGTVEHFNRIYFCVISTAYNADLPHTPHCRSPGRLVPCSSYWPLIQAKIHLWEAGWVSIGILQDVAQTGTGMNLLHIRWLVLFPGLPTTELSLMLVHRCEDLDDTAGLAAGTQHVYCTGRAIQSKKFHLIISPI
jgi:hypothetical protein